MDRDTTIALAVTIIVLTLIGGIYLAPSGKSGMPAQASEEPASTSRLSPDDIRYKYQQAALKDRKKHKSAPDAEPSEPSENEEPSAEAPSSDDSSDVSAEEPQVDD